MEFCTSLAGQATPTSNSHKLAALELCYIKSSGLPHLDCGSGRFAMFDSASNELALFCAPDDQDAPAVVAGSFLDTFAYYVLIDAQKNNAKFTVIEKTCFCEIATVSESGGTYIEAALKALSSVRGRQFQE